MNETANEIALLVGARDFNAVRAFAEQMPSNDLAALLEELQLEEQVIVFRLLPRKLAAAVFEYLSIEEQEQLLKAMAQEDIAAILNEMHPDDRTDLLDELPANITKQMLALLTSEERAVAVKLLGYPEGSIGRLMTPNYVRVRPSWTVEQSLDHIRRHGQDSETLTMIYVVDESGVLIDDLHIRSILLASPNTLISELMDEHFVALTATDPQEVAVKTFGREDCYALPVTDTAGVLIGIVTLDDVLDVAEEQATKDIQKLGGMEALEEPYMRIGFLEMIRKRAGWLTLLFLGEMFTATAMGFFEKEIERAVVLALFVPLIISSGGNSGSQAATLVIRALAVGEVELNDWFHILRRELLSGFSLGVILGMIGFLRIALWSVFTNIYGPHWFLIGLTVGITLVGIVMWGTLTGSMLPFVMKRLGFDPATSSTPFVATLVDITGLLIYFSVAAILLRGTIL